MIKAGSVTAEVLGEWRRQTEETRAAIEAEIRDLRKQLEGRIAVLKELPRRPRIPWLAAVRDVVRASPGLRAAEIFASVSATRPWTRPGSVNNALDRLKDELRTEGVRGSFRYYLRDIEPGGAP